jgi:hypothetical protein
MLWPFAGSDLKSAGDLHAVVASVVEARNALRETQFPIRVAPNQLGSARYPFFQFYGNLPYTAAGLIDLIPGVGPYNAWKAVMFAALVCGGTYTLRCATLMLGRRRGRAGGVVAGVAFMSAPYMLTDVFARGAFTESVAFNLLPAMFFYSFRAFLKPGARNVVFAAIAWGLVGLSHNITYVFASIFLSLLVLSFVRFDRRYARRVIRLGVTCAIQAAMLAWYFVPQAYVLDALNITAETRAQPQSRTLGRVPLSVMLAPTRTPPPTAPETALGLQIGWPILAGVICAAAMRWRQPVTRRLLALFALACFMAWSPIDFWRRLPETLRFVQFPYRLLAFATLFGSILLAFAVSWRRSWLAIFVLGLVGFSASTYWPAYLPGDPEGVARAVERPEIGGLNDYLVSLKGSPKPSPSRQTLHVLYYPRLLRVRVDKKPVAYFNDAGFIAVDVPPSRHRVDAKFVGVRWANVVSGMAWIGVFAMTLRIKRAARGRHRSSILVTLAGVAAFTAGTCCRPLIASIRLALHPPLKVSVSASRPSDPAHAPTFAFDENPLTEWAAAGSDPITLIVVPAHPSALKRVELDARAGGLFEAWEFVRVELYESGRRVFARDFNIPQAADQSVVTLKLPDGVGADRVEFHFDKPVTKLHDGRRVEASAVNPGYREIRLTWDK